MGIAPASYPTLWIPTFTLTYTSNSTLIPLLTTVTLSPPPTLNPDSTHISRPFPWKSAAVSQSKNNKIACTHYRQGH